MWRRRAPPSRTPILPRSTPRRAIISISPARCCAPRRRASSRSGARAEPASRASRPRSRRCVGAAPGARVLNSDRLRKTLYGVEPTVAPAGRGLCATRCPTQVYALLRDETARVAAAGWSVIVDAVHARPSERDAIEAVARAANIPFAGFWLDTEAALAAERVAARRDDVSDATPQVVDAQRRYEIGAMTWTRIDASRQVSAIAEDIASKLSAIG